MITVIVSVISARMIRFVNTMVATAIYAVKEGKPLSDEAKRLVTQPTCSGKMGTLSQGELS
jgi:hypothetical protein